MDNLLNNKDKILKIRENVNNLDSSLFEHYIIDHYNTLDFSNYTTIIMTTHNRSKQTYFTLQSMLKSKCKKIQVIIVDDSDLEPIDLNILKNYPYYIDLIAIKRENKNWINPVVNYNIGFKFIKGDNIVIQNAEVCHIGDPLDFISNKMEQNNYYVFDVNAVKSYENNEEIYKSDISNVEIYNKPFFEVWYQHFLFNNRKLHFFTALKRETFNKIQEFSYDFSLGLSFDDDDFLLKIISNNINIINVENDKYNVGGIHLYHTLAEKCWGVNVSSNNDIYTSKLEYYNNNNKYIDYIFF